MKYYILGDGIFDKLNSKDVIRTVWESTEQEKATNIHQQCGLAVEQILRESITRRTLDNITVVVIGFKNFKQSLFPRKPKADQENIQESQKSVIPLKPNTQVNTKLAIADRSLNKENNLKEDTNKILIKAAGAYGFDENPFLLSISKSIDLRDRIVNSKPSPLSEINGNMKNQIRGSIINQNIHGRQKSEIRHGGNILTPNAQQKSFDFKSTDTLSKLMKGESNR